MLNNSKKTDRLMKFRLRLLERTIKLRGVECLRIRNNNQNYQLVHGRNNFDVSGDNRIDSDTKIVLVILNLNNLEDLGDKGSYDQTIYYPHDEFNKGDIIKYSNDIYTYQFQVTDKRYYGERNGIYEYQLEHLKTILNE